MLPSWNHTRPSSLTAVATDRMQVARIVVVVGILTALGVTVGLLFTSQARSPSSSSTFSVCKLLISRSTVLAPNDAIIEVIAKTKVIAHNEDRTTKV